MLLRSISNIGSDPVGFIYAFLLIVFGMTIAITVHEFSHAYVAHRRGDDTAARLGRVSLNPLVHLDPLGTIFLLVAGFGWGKPVPVNVNYMRQPVRWSMAAVSAAGAGANLATGIVVGLVFRLLPTGSPGVLADLLGTIVWINVLLAVFNLIPLPPLDGFNVLSAALPERVMRPIAPIVRYGPFILFGLLIIGSFLPTSVLSFIDWPIDHITGAFLGIPV